MAASTKDIMPKYDCYDLPDNSGNDDCRCSTAFALKRIAYNSLLVLNDRDFAHTSPMGQEVRACIAPGYEARLDNYPDVMSWEQLNDVWVQWAAEDPKLKFLMQSVSAYVDEDKGQASVYMDMDVEGLGGASILKAFTELKWRREGGKKGKWMAYQFHGMRGVKELCGLVPQ